MEMTHGVKGEMYSRFVIILMKLGFHSKIADSGF